MSVNKVNKKTGDLSLLAGGTFYADNPIGSIIPYGGSTAPAGWFICDGTELVRSTYPELFAVIGTSFGTPSDNTKFKLPDLREATTKGVGLTGKSNNHMDADGLALGEFIDDRLKAHTHFGNYGAVGNGVVGAVPTTGTNYNAAIGTTDTGYATNEVKAVGVNYIIKAVSVGVPTDFMSAVDKAVDEAVDEVISSKVGIDRHVGDFEVIANTQRIIRFPSANGSVFMNLFFEGHNGGTCGGVMLSGYNELEGGRIRGIYYVGSTSWVIVNVTNYGVIIASPSTSIKIHYEITSSFEPRIETAQPITISSWSDDLYQVTNS